MHIGWKDVLKVENNNPHKYASKLRGFPFTLQTNTICHFVESDSTNRRTVYKLYAFYNKRLQMLFKDQLVQSQVTCPFKDFLPSVEGFPLDGIILSKCLNEIFFSCVLSPWIEDLI